MHDSALLVRIILRWSVRLYVYKIGREETQETKHLYGTKYQKLTSFPAVRMLKPSAI